MTKSEGCCGERVENAGVDVRLVLVTVQTRGEDLEVAHEVRTEDNWEPLVVSYVLK